MTEKELARMRRLERRIREIAEEHGLMTTDIAFDIVPARRVIEAMAYQFPMNFSHWTFGRDYDRIRTIYEHTGSGIPYEVVWNFEPPRAFLVANNPFALNVLTIAHVYGHVDYYLRNQYLRHGRVFGDIAEEARYAAKKFQEYTNKYGKDVERLIDSAMAIRWHQHPDPFYEEQDEERVREYLTYVAKEKLRALNKLPKDAQKKHKEEISGLQNQLEELQNKTPPEPVYDLLHYIIHHAPQLRRWEKNVLSIIRNQARALAPNRRTKMLDEGWATYWHAIIMRQLFDEGMLTPEEHGVFLDYHSKVTRANKIDFNVYCVGPAIYEYVKKRWDKGQFGRKYDECTNPVEKDRWDTGAMEGNKQIFEVAKHYTDRMAVEEFFTDDFIRGMDLYIYKKILDEKKKEIVYVVVENNPKVIRQMLKSAFALYDMPIIVVADGNHNSQGELYLAHHYTGRELLANYRNGALERIFRLWRRPVHLETVADEKRMVFSYNGKSHEEKEKDDGDTTELSLVS